MSEFDSTNKFELDNARWEFDYAVGNVDEYNAAATYIELLEAKLRGFGVEILHTYQGS